MITRYTHPEMGAIWSEQRRYETWLEVELAADRRDGRSRHRARGGRARASREGARSTSPASRRSSRPRSTTSSRSRPRSPSTSGPPPRWLHFGLTSSDVVDTAQAIQMREACGPDRQGHRRADGRRARPGRGAPAHADDRPDARRARRADDLRPEARAVVRGAAARSRPRAARARRRLGRQDLGRGRARSRISTRRSKRASARRLGLQPAPVRRRSSSAIATPS